MALMEKGRKGGERVDCEPEEKPSQKMLGNRENRAGVMPGSHPPLSSFIPPEAEIRC